MIKHRVLCLTSHNNTRPYIIWTQFSQHFTYCLDEVFFWGGGSKYSTFLGLLGLLIVRKVLSFSLSETAFRSNESLDAGTALCPGILARRGFTVFFSLNPSTGTLGFDFFLLQSSFSTCSA